MGPIRRRRTALFTILLAAAAQPCAEAAALDLRGAVGLALAGNPELALAGMREDAQSGRVLQAGLGPNPELSLSVENFLGGGAYQGTDLTETTLSLAWVLERGKRERRVAAAKVGLELLRIDADIARLEVAAQTTEFFLAVLNDQERLREAHAALQLGDDVVAAVQRRVQTGSSPAADLDRVEADRALLALARDSVAQQLRVSRRQLAASWGARELPVNEIAGDLYALAEPESFETMLSRLTGSPRINRYLTERRLRDAELALAEAQARPDWQLEAGVRYFDFTSDAAFVAGVQLPLGIRNRNQGRIAEVRAQAAVTDGERVATRLRIETTLYGLHEDLEHGIRRFAAIRDRLLPLTERMVGSAHEAYERGSYGYFDLREAQIRLLEARAALREEAFRVHLGRARIERLTGFPAGPP